jgi:hypothetical protein
MRLRISWEHLWEGTIARLGPSSAARQPAGAFLALLVSFFAGRAEHSADEGR